MPTRAAQARHPIFVTEVARILAVAGLAVALHTGGVPRLVDARHAPGRLPVRGGHVGAPSGVAPFSGALDPHRRAVAARQTSPLTWYQLGT